LLSKPEQLSVELHARILKNLRDSLVTLQKGGRAKGVRVRDWLFAFSDGQPTVQVFLETVDETASAVRSAADWRSPSLGDCAKVHRWLLDQDLFADFDDSVQVEVGSLGSMPPLREAGEFALCVGGTLDLVTWESGAGKRFKGCRLFEVLLDGTGCSIVIESKSQRLTIPLSLVRSAFLMSLSEPKSEKEARGG
jgi:ribosome maturation factor RimP